MTMKYDKFLQINLTNLSHQVSNHEARYFYGKIKV